MDDTQRSCLERLHQALPYDSRAQVFIDAYLLCTLLSDPTVCAACPSLRSRMLVLDPVDTLQLGNLPDLGAFIRRVLMDTLAWREGGGEVWRDAKPGGMCPRSRLADGLAPRPEVNNSTVFLVECIHNCLARDRTQGVRLPGRCAKGLDQEAPAQDARSGPILVNILMGSMLGMYLSCG